MFVNPGSTEQAKQFMQLRAAQVAVDEHRFAPALRHRHRQIGQRRALPFARPRRGDDQRAQRIV
jgi:hypothetical protein